MSFFFLCFGTFHWHKYNIIGNTAFSFWLCGMEGASSWCWGLAVVRVTSTCNTAGTSVQLADFLQDIRSTAIWDMHFQCSPASWCTLPTSECRAPTPYRILKRILSHTQFLFPAHVTISSTVHFISPHQVTWSAPHWPLHWSRDSVQHKCYTPVRIKQCVCFQHAEL